MCKHTSKGNTVSIDSISTLKGQKNDVEVASHQRSEAYDGSEY